MLTIGQLLAMGRLPRNNIGRLSGGIRMVLCTMFLSGSLPLVQCLVWCSGWFLSWMLMWLYVGDVTYEAVVRLLRLVA